MRARRITLHTSRSVDRKVAREWRGAGRREACGRRRAFTRRTVEFRSTPPTACPVQASPRHRAHDDRDRHHAVQGLEAISAARDEPERVPVGRVRLSRVRRRGHTEGRDARMSASICAVPWVAHRIEPTSMYGMAAASRASTQTTASSGVTSFRASGVGSIARTAVPARPRHRTRGVGAGYRRP